MSSFKGNDLSQQPEIMRRVTSVLRDTYDYSYHHPGAAAQNPNTDACDEEFGDWFGIGGPPSYVVDRIGEMVELGLDFFVTALPSPREQFAGDVMPALRALSDRPGRTSTRGGAVTTGRARRARKDARGLGR